MQRRRSHSELSKKATRTYLGGNELMGEIGIVQDSVTLSTEVKRMSSSAHSDDLVRNK